MQELIQVQNSIGTCDGFVKTSPASGREFPSKETRVIVISPIKITIDEGTHSDSRIRVVNGCNMGENCQNPDCWFGAVIREIKRAESRERKEMER